MSEVTSHKPAREYCTANRRSSGRVHLPVAPKAFARVRFTPEKPLPRALSPQQAVNWLEYLEQQGESIQVVNLNGPGDPLATPETSLATLGLLREKFPQVSICLTTLGLKAADLADELAKYGLAHVSILMDAVDPEVASKVFAWVRPGAKTLPLAEACRLLIDEQAEAVGALVRAGLQVQIKTTVYPGINSEHIEQIAKKAASLGAHEMKLFPFLERGEDCPTPAAEATPQEMALLTSRAADYLPAKFIDLAACREVIEFDFSDPAAGKVALPKPSKSRPNLAVVSSDGFEVDLHLGQALQYLIYGPNQGPVSLLGTRPAPEPGGGESRWQQTALTLGDCFAVLAAAAGEAPKRILAEKGLTVISQEGNLESMVDALFGGGKKKKGGRK